MRNRSYPALVPAQGAVNGMLVTGLTDDEWRVLDAFEDDVYELRRLTLSDDRVGWAYVCPDETQAFPHDWDAEEFAANQLTDYVSACVSWRMRYDAEAAVH